MKNPFVEKAFETLFSEINRISDGNWREKATLRTQFLKKIFEESEGMKADNPPGKAVVRSKTGRIMGLQG